MKDSDLYSNNFPVSETFQSQLPFFIGLDLLEGLSILDIHQSIVWRSQYVHCLDLVEISFLYQDWRRGSGITPFSLQTTCAIISYFRDFPVMVIFFRHSDEDNWHALKQHFVMITGLVGLAAAI